MAHIIVVGNEKGGAGKSTVSMHIATSLVRLNHTVGVLDLDLRQRSFGRYIDNRIKFMESEQLDLPCPVYCELPKIAPESLGPGENLYDQRLSAAVTGLEREVEFILIDCPGSHTRLSQVAHSLADTLVTPLNDSFVDFDLLAHTDPKTGKVLSPSVYAEMVWNARQLRAQAGLEPIDWVVVRNRVGAQAMHNKKEDGRGCRNAGQAHRFSCCTGFCRAGHLSRIIPARPDPSGPSGHRYSKLELVECRRSPRTSRTGEGT